MSYFKTTELPSVHHDQDQGQSDSDELILPKVVAMVTLSLATFILGMLPYKIVQWFKWERTEDGSLDKSTNSKLTLSLMLCFGGGALLCTTFLHMLPEVEEAVKKLQADGRIATPTFALTELIMCCGFFTMYLVEELVHRYLHWREGPKGPTVEDQAIHRSFSIRKCPGQRDSNMDTTEENQNSTSGFKTLDNYPSLVTVTTVQGTDKNKLHEGEILPAADIITHLGHSHIVFPMKKDPVVASVRGLLVVLALSIHELFEGLAVGLQPSVSYVWYMLSAVSAHKLVIAFCVGLELVSSRTKLRLIVIYIGTFALVSPIGIGVGMGLSSNSEEDVEGGVANVVLQGMATGTLLYVVFFEVLMKERASKESGLRQLVAIMAGFCLMLGLLVAVGHNHEHDHSHGEEDHTHQVETIVHRST